MMLDVSRLENFCANTCFVILLLTTLYYWSKTIFAGDAPYTKIGLIGYTSALFCLTLHLLLRWINSGHFPLSNLYESLVFLAWCLLVLHIYIELSMKNSFVGVLTSPAILCLVAFTDFSLPPELQKSSPLVPALQSNWLVMHVTVMIASYAALLLGCLVSIAYLIFSRILTTKAIQTDLSESQLETITKNFSLDNSFFNKSELTFTNANETVIVTNDNLLNRTTELEIAVNPLNTQLSTKKIFSNKILDFLDNLSYRTIGIGFCFLTLGILSGAVWANETWGNYWSWDPKETWAFITWLTFATYLHSRLVGGWTGSKPAWIATVGFLTVWICYLGVNLLGQGLHSYGFLQI